jgi:hypothetical protein
MNPGVRLLFLLFSPPTLLAHQPPLACGKLRTYAEVLYQFGLRGGCHAKTRDQRRECED